MSVFRNDVNADKTGVNLKYAAKAASTVVTENTLLALNATGFLAPATNASTAIRGLAIRRVTAADADYAEASNVAFDEPREGETFIMDVDDAGTVGFVAGVERSIIDAGTIKAAALAGADVALVVVQKVLTDQDKAIVTLKTITNKS